MSVHDLPDFLTVTEAAGLLRIGRTSAYAEAHRWEATKGEAGIPVIRFGRSLRVPKAALLKLMQLTPDAAEGA